MEAMGRPKDVKQCEQEIRAFKRQMGTGSSDETEKPELDVDEFIAYIGNEL